jgi:hypothetical protein
MEFIPARSINEVILRLNAVVDHAIETKDPIGIFAALYAVVTEKVKEGIDRNYFQDGERMERLDVIFANRYLNALYCFRNNQNCGHAWKVAFVIAQRFPTHLILQELLVGMNAHINLDLAIAAAQASPGDKLDALKDDFYAINRILADLVDDIKNDLSHLSPRIAWVLKWMVGEDAILNFSIRIARDEAWRFARKLNTLQEGQWHDITEERDKEMASLGNRIGKQGWLYGILIWWVKLKESKDVPHIVRELRITARAKAKLTQGSGNLAVQA